MLATRIKDKKIECIVFVLFAISLAVVGIFHEPWFDEAQAWQIARCASLKEILFVIPHYEGHPALWHLMLLLPAKLGFPYEFSLGLFSYVAILLSGWLILFHSSFPKIVKCLLPFHYFVFYQNGVVSRPYGYMTLALMLMALTFKKRNEHPWRFMLSMAFLCALSGYGIVIAGGVALAWTLEICAEKQWKLKPSLLIKDGRVISLGALLLLALILIVQIMPRSNTFAFSIERANPVWKCMLYSFFAMIPDASLLNILECEGMPRFSALDPSQFCIAIVLGIIFLIAVYFCSTKRNRSYFFIPYLFFALFTGVVYFSAHHMGISISLIVFWFWVAFEDDKRGKAGQAIFERLKLSEKDANSLKKVGVLLALIPIVMPVIWTAVASLNDIRYDYFNSRGTTKFLKNHGMENVTVLVEWGEVTESDWSDEKFFEKVNAYGLDVSVDPVSIMPYFDHNFCINLNGGRDDMAYAAHRFASADESREEFRKLKAMGLPDAIFGHIDLKRIYGEEATGVKYVPVYKITPRYISVWKIFRTFGDSFKSRYIYVREDMLEKYGLERINE